MYQASELEEQLEAAPAGPEHLSYPSILGRIEALEGRPLPAVTNALLTELENVSGCRLPAVYRVALLHRVRNIVIKGLSPESDEADANDSGDQRRLEVLVLARLVQELEGPLNEIDAMYVEDRRELNKERIWLLRNIFLLSELLVRHSIAHGQDVPGGTWRRLHDLFAQLVKRGHARVYDHRDQSQTPQGNEIFHVYKRVLLLGLAQRLGGDHPGSPVMRDLFDFWAMRSDLERPDEQHDGENFILVDQAHDRAPHIGSRPGPTFRGWVLKPHSAFLRYIKRSRESIPLLVNDPFSEEVIELQPTETFPV